MSFEDDPRPSPDPPWMTSTLGRLRPWVEWFGVARLAIAAVTVVAVVLAGWWLLRSPAPPTEAGLPRAGASTPSTAATMPSSPPSTAPAIVVVHVAGAVSRPGVYELPGGARVHQAVDAAGGALADAAPGALNLAAVLADGARIYVPVVGEAVPLDVPPAAGSTAPAGPIDLNRATADELDALPGIGPATAQAIVEHRTANGPFATVDELEAVRGIGPAKLDAIRGLVMV